ncbi:sialin-like isoform X1 [Oratosquilla oratoria]|uniref:sialin-like isoform X1 n=1 Tax=Oratosquilla oratoria TaxID=337810 RepID=UPI003F765A6D
MTISGWIEKIPARVSLGVLSMLGFINLYISRVNLSIIIVAMVRPASSNQSEAIASECKTEESPDSINNSVVTGNVTNIKPTEVYGNFDWDDHIQGLILGSFFWGYAIFQVPGGRLAEMYGPKKIFGISILSGGIAAILSPIAAETSYIALTVLRALQGFCQSVAWPSMHVMVAQWIPQHERSTFIGATFFATSIGTVTSLPLCGAMIEAYGWESAFYLTGILSLIWCLFWAFLVYDSPTQHPRISKEELEYIQDDTKARDLRVTSTKVPWKSIITSRPVWALIITDTLSVIGLYLLIIKVPSYTKNVLGFSIKDSGLISALPFLLRYFGAVIWGSIGHQLIVRKITSINTSRKLCASISTFLPAVCMLGVAYAGCNPTAAVTLMTASMFFNGAVSGGHMVTFSDISPNYTGTTFGISNMMASVPGFLVPPVVAAIIDNQHTIEHWQRIFWICIPAYTLGGLVFLLFATTEEQPWNNPQSQVREKSLEAEEGKEMIDKAPIQKKMSLS